MKIIRYRNSGITGYAAETGNGRFAKINGSLFEGYEITNEPVVPEKLLAPIDPPVIWCIGQNYRRHAAEVNMAAPEFPVIFAKGINAVQHPHEPILIPRHAPSIEVDYECELAVVIGKACKNVNREEALGYVLGYTCTNDVSARDWQLRMGGGQWSRGKSFDTFAPLGPCLATPESIPNPNALRIQTVLNGETMQDWNTNDMIHDVPRLISFLSQSATLLPGTVICTGTPHGIGMARKPPRWLREGDEVSIIIEGIGTLTNTVAMEP
jgi:2-keto-4-pentenoate hydratase/2-oxohepta-3-ene-1,7-dioic acid hydratase in catechol pathway